MRQAVYIWVAIGLLWPAAVGAEQPLDILQKGLQEGISLLKRPSGEAPSAGQVQAQRLWGLADRLFDFNEFSRRVLAAQAHA